ncbi:MAG TPA: hypothetical protein PLO89_01315, partial [Spirochaetota bacterium]|nr:hypothetical protein [Spirochaetota bacterium]
MKFFLLFIFFFFLFSAFSDEWKVSKSDDFLRITDSKIKDLDQDGIDEIIASYFGFRGKFILVYKVINNELILLDEIKVPKNTIFFDAGDFDNDGDSDILFLTSEGLYFRKIENLFIKKSDINITSQTFIKQIKNNKKTNNDNFTFVKNIFSEIVVPQPELLKSVNLIIDLDGNKLNELVIENVRSIEIFETENFTLIDKINLETVLEFSMVPGQFYPQYIFYTLPIILVDDLDNDNKKEIVTKFPRSINIYSLSQEGKYENKKTINMNEDNVYFLSNSFVKFSFPVISDTDNDNIKEIVISSAN